jgi:NAD(P)-dependent dehydrogenase (short-subunit alcohol dehydrogenase family)
MSSIAGRVAMVTGAGGGIGLGIARRLAAEGATIVVAEVDPDSGAEAARSIAEEHGVPTHFIPTDVTRRDAVEAAVEVGPSRYGRLDILVNNAWGGGSLGRLEHKTDDAMAHGLTMALWPGFWSMRAAFPHLKAHGTGRIVNICSLNGVNAHQFTAEYNTGKEALRALTRTAAREWARHAITANVICPAAATAAFRSVVERNPEIGVAAAAANPMGRMGDAEADIGGVAAFLAGDDARYLTGNTLFVDGGAHINGAAWDPDLPD